MAQKPFLFDSQTFDDDAMVAQVAEKAERAIYTQSQFDQSTTNARAEGEADGYANALSSMEAQMKEMLQSLPDAVQQWQDADRVRTDALQADAVQVALSVIRKILPSLAETQALPNIEQFIIRALAERFEEKRVVIRVAPHLLDALKSRIDAISAAGNFSGNLILLPEPSMPVADCRLEWAEGGAERDTARLYQDIELLIEQFMLPAATDTAGAAATDNLTEETPNG